MKLHLGCGYDVKKGFINVDKIPVNNEVVKIDLNKRLPFEDNTFSYVFSQYVIEHIYNFDGLIDEIWRVSKPDATVEIIVPHFTSITAYSPSHLIFFTSTAFNHRTNNKGDHRIVNNKYFKLLKSDIIWNAGLNPLNYIGRIFNWKPIRYIYEDMVFCRLFPARDVHFKLKVIK